MGSYEKPEGAAARGELSRRTVFVGAAVAPALAADAANARTDPSVAICQRWIEANAEIDRLDGVLGRCEKALDTAFNWRSLSQSEQDAIPEGRKLEEISEQIEALGWECDALVQALPKTPAASPAAVIANLTVAAGLFYPNDHPQAHGLVTRAIRDLKALNRST